jgi:hypothetical protein
MANYYRITAYHKEKDISIIMDSYGLFEKKWQFSADLIRRGFDIIEVSDDTQFLDGNIERLKEPKQDKLILRACSMGKPKYISKDKKEIGSKTVVVGNKEYIPNKTIES